jgi:hypothetical protein
MIAKKKGVQAVLFDMEYKTLLYYSDQDYLNKIPDRQGNYHWIHYVEFPDEVDINLVREILLEYSRIDLSFPEEGFGKKFFYKIGEVGYGHDKSKGLLGLALKNEAILLDYLSDKANFENFKTFWKDLCFRRPFYIGKAIKLRSRIKDHINGNGNSPILKFIKEQNIDKSHIWIGYEEIPSIDLKILNIFEEITQIKLKPGLTKNFG